MAQRSRPSSCEPAQCIQLALIEIGQRRAHRTRGSSNRAHASLHNRNRIALSAIAYLYVRQYKLAKPLKDLFAIAPAHSGVERLRELRKEVEDGRRIRRHAHLQVR